MMGAVKSGGGGCLALLLLLASMALYGLSALAGALVFGAALFLPRRALLRVLELLTGLLSGLLLVGGWARLLVFGGTYGPLLGPAPDLAAVGLLAALLAILAAAAICAALGAYRHSVKGDSRGLRLLWVAPPLLLITLVFPNGFPLSDYAGVADFQLPAALLAFYSVLAGMRARHLTPIAG
jgi:hypothetical protein